MLGDTSSSSGLRNQSNQESMPAAITDIGCEREINEDRYAVIDATCGRAWVVCDGMGGELGGELAAQLAIDAIRRGLESSDFETLEEAARTAVLEANRIIVLRRQNPAFSSMGTTSVAALIEEDEVVIANAGDSRAYLVRDGKIQQLTRDHTYVQDLVERGVISQQEALSHPQAHVLTRCLGASPMLELDIHKFWLWDTTGDETNDKLVLCSDGLYSLISDEEIAQAVNENIPQEACVQLTELAKERGGFDNITMVILPLEGRLHEESSGKLRKSAKKKKKQVAEPMGFTLPEMSRGKKIAIMVCLAVLGGIFATLAVLMKLMGAA